MSFGATELTYDFLLALALFSIIVSTVFVTRRFSNIWINRKLIHLSASPAVISYMYLFNEPYIFFVFGVFFTLVLILPHIKAKELSWFQEKKNYGEVFFCVSFSALSILFWDASTRMIAGVAMLFMAVGDSFTGMVRSRFLKERAKHWSGSVAMLVSCIIIGYVFLGLNGMACAVVATLAEYQPWIDDNLSVPFITMTTGVLINII
ncbi:MAG: hypothetical protein QXJ17_08560 [Nitrososphaeria archaeon]